MSGNNENLLKKTLNQDYPSNYKIPGSTEQIEYNTLKEGIFVSLVRRFLILIFILNLKLCFSKIRIESLLEFSIKHSTSSYLDAQRIAVKTCVTGIYGDL
jgi:hypothetical protein